MNIIIFPLVTTTLLMALSQSCEVFVDRFRPPSAKSNKFFLRFGSGNAIVNPTKELDSLQHDFNLPFLCSSNARHVLETLKGNAGLDATSSAAQSVTAPFTPAPSSAPFSLSRPCAALGTGYAPLWVYPLRS